MLNIKKQKYWFKRARRLYNQISKEELRKIPKNMRFSAGTHYLNTILHKYNPLSLKTEEKMEHYNEEKT